MTMKTYIATIEVVECADCHMDFGITEQFEKDRRSDHSVFYCPAGHHNYYPYKSDEEKLREQNARLSAQLVSAQDQRGAAERSARAYKGQVTKVKKRIGKGVCPCCNRQFTNVERHMATQHPDEAGAKPERVLP